jgi:hypothetical protein
MKNDTRQPTQMDWLRTVEFIPDDDVVGNALRDGLQKSSGASRKQSIISTNVATI